MISVREGVVWLLLATVAELTPVVRPTHFLMHTLFHHSFLTGVRLLEPERYFGFPPISQPRTLKLLPISDALNLVGFLRITNDAHV